MSPAKMRGSLRAAIRKPGDPIPGEARARQQQAEELGTILFALSGLPAEGKQQLTKEIGIAASERFTRDAALNDFLFNFAGKDDPLTALGKRPCFWMCTIMGGLMRGETLEEAVLHSKPFYNFTLPVITYTTLGVISTGVGEFAPLIGFGGLFGENLYVGRQAATGDPVTVHGLVFSWGTGTSFGGLWSVAPRTAWIVGAGLQGYTGYQEAPLWWDSSGLSDQQLRERNVDSALWLVGTTFLAASFKPTFFPESAVPPAATAQAGRSPVWETQPLRKADVTDVEYNPGTGLYEPVQTAGGTSQLPVTSQSGGLTAYSPKSSEVSPSAGTSYPVAVAEGLSVATAAPAAGETASWAVQTGSGMVVVDLPPGYRPATGSLSSAGSSGDGAIRVVGPDGEFRYLELPNEPMVTYYRNMSETHWNQLESTGVMPPSNKETMITPSLDYLSLYKGTQAVTVEFTVPGVTIARLDGIGVRNNEPRIVEQGYGYLPLVEAVDNWKETNALFKYEKGYVNIGLGNGAALDIWNEAIKNGGFQKVPTK